MRRSSLQNVALAAVAFGMVAGCTWSRPDPGPAQMAAEVARLEQVLPVLQELRVTSFTAEDGCSWLVYVRGAFFEGGDPCQPGTAIAFDAEARADHARIAQAIATSGAPTGRVLAATVDPRGRMLSVHFLHSAHPFPWQWEYLYDPGNIEAKLEGGALQTDYIRVDGAWWFRASLDD